MTQQALSPIDKPYYSKWQALYCAFYDKRLYIDVLKRWKGFGLIYVLLMCFVFCIPVAIKTCLQFNAFFNDVLVDPISKIPMMAIQKGQVFIGKPQPYIIKNKMGETSIVIDTAKDMSDLKSSYPNAMMLVTKSVLYFKPVTPTFFDVDASKLASSQSVEQVLTDNENYIFDGPAFLDSLGMKKLRWYSLSIIYPMLGVVVFSVYLVLYLVLGLMAQFIAALFFKTKLTYKQSVRLLSVAGTPQAFIFAQFLALHFLPPGLGVLIILLLALYFCFAVIVIKREANQLVHH